MREKISTILLGCACLAVLPGWYWLTLLLIGLAFVPSLIVYYHDNPEK